jgi:subtilisin family serine protease
MVEVVAFLTLPPSAERPLCTAAGTQARSALGHAQLIERLQQRAAARSFVTYLQRLSASGSVADIRSFWIADVVSFSVAASQLDEVVSHPDLHYLAEDKPLQLVEPVSLAESEGGYVGSPAYVDLVGARTLWELGYTGRGRLVCSFDTGVDGSHPALASTWLGAATGFPSRSWFDPLGSEFPVDENGHGTHTMGIMLGRDGADTTGVAFNAKWISAAVVDRGQSLNGTISDIIAAYQWAADPDGDPNTVEDLPDVICNSWGIPKGLLEPCDETFWQAIDNIEALGVVAVFACGNEGPGEASIRNPADRASSPLNSF